MQNFVDSAEHSYWGDAHYPPLINALLNWVEKDQKPTHPAWGEDVKVMGIRYGDRVELTVACAMIGKYLTHMDDYFAQVGAIERLVRDLAARHGFPDCKIHVNAADNPNEGEIYLTGLHPLSETR